MAYGMHVYKQKFLEEEKNGYRRELKEKEWLIDEKKAQLEHGRKISQRLMKEIESLAEECLKLKEVMNKQHATD